MAVSYVTIASGFTVSSAFALFPADRAVAVWCASHAASGVQLAYSQTSGTGPFGLLLKWTGTGEVFTVFSGAADGFGVVEYIPTPWGRVVMTSAALDTRSFALFPLN